MRLRSKISFLVALFSFSIFMPAKIFAAGNVLGTHLAFFDPGNQIRILQFIKSLKPPAQYPITAVAEISWGEASNDSLTGLAAELNAADYAINLRIAGLAADTTPAQVIALAQKLNQVTWARGKPIVIFGNEDNNIDVELHFSDLNVASAKYAELFTAFAGALDTSKMDLSAAPIPEHPKYPQSAFLNGATTAFKSSKISAFAFNLYDNGAGSFEPSGWRTQQALEGVKPRKVLTEFGPNPQNPADNTYKNWSEFLKKYENTLPEGFQTATVLVPNLCDKTTTMANQWYYYILGNFYDPNMNEIDETCSTQTGTVIFPGPDDIFSSCTGAGKGASCESKFQEVASKYMMTCSPVITFKPSIEPAGEEIKIGSFVGTLLDYCADKKSDNNCVFNPVDNTIDVNADNATFPYIRSQTPGRTGSLEGFFTTDTQRTRTNMRDFTQYSPLSKLQPAGLTCKQNIQQLDAVETLCREFADPTKQGQVAKDQASLIDKFRSALGLKPDACDLNTIVDGKKYLDILKDVRDATGGNAQSYCSSNAFLSPKTDTDIALARLVMRVQPVLKAAYKKAYFIIYLQAPSKSANSLSTSGLSALFRTGDQELFKIVPVLIPATFGSQKDDSDIYRIDGTKVEGATFNGAYAQTIAPLLSGDAQKNIADKLIGDEQTILSKMQKLGSASPEDPGLLNISGCVPGPASQSSLACQFASRVNAGLQAHEFTVPNQKGTCEFYEEVAGGQTAKILNTPVKAGFLDSIIAFFESLLFPKPSGVNITGNINVNNLDEIPEDQAKIRVFLLIPRSEFGLIRYTEQGLFQTIVPNAASQKVFDEASAGKILDTNGFLRTEGVALDEKGGATRSYSTNQTPEPVAPPATPVPITTELTASFKPQGDANPLLYGGWLIRMIHSFTAQVLAPIASSIYDASYDATKGLENYWLKGGSGSPNTLSKKLTACSQYKSLQTVMPDEDGVKKMVCQAAQKYSVPPSVLWGLFRIEGGTARNIADNGGGSVQCNVNSTGATGPMQQIQDVCRVRLPICEQEPTRPECQIGDTAAQGKNTCDLGISLDLAARQLQDRAMSANQEFLNPDGTANWYWIAGFYYLGAKVLPGREFHTPQCAGSPAVDGCGGLNYCQCAVDRFQLDCGAL